MGTGVNVSKAQVYSVIGPHKGMSVSKTVIYAVIQPPDPGINVSKAVVYAVLTEQVTPPVTGHLVEDSLGSISDSASGSIVRIAGDEAIDPLAITDLVSATLWRAITSSLVDSLGSIQDIVSGTLNPVRYASVIDSLPLTDTTKGASISLSSRNRWVAPIDITPVTGLIDPVHIAAHPIRHPSKFYEPRIKSYGQFTRSIGVPVGFVRTGDCQLSIVDADNEFRQAISPKTIINGKAEVRLGPEGGPLSAFLRPFIRSVSAVDQPGDGEIRITLRDFITQSFEQQIPPLVTKENFPNLPEESNGAFAPIVLGNVSVQNYIANVHGDGFIEEFAGSVLKTILSRYFVGPNPGGAIKAILVDPTAHTYLVARHPCKSVKAYKYSNETVGYVPAGLYATFTQRIASGELCQFISLPYDPEGAEIRVNVEAVVDSDGSGGALNEFIGFYGHGWPIIDSIGMIYSPVSDDEIRRTEEVGDEAALVNIEPPEVSGTTNNFVGFFGRGWPYIDAIGIIYSPDGSTELKLTEEAGDEKGGFAYADTAIPAGKTIAGIRIWSADYIDAIQIIYKDGMGALSYGTKHGGPGGTLKTFTFQAGEYILRIRGKFGRYIDSLVIETNLRTSTWYGGTGGAYGSYSIAINAPPDPEAITPLDGIVFSDGPIPEGCRIAGIRVWHGDYIDALQLIYEGGEGDITYGTKHGGSGGDMAVFALAEGEYIISIAGKWGDHIDSLTIKTNLRTSMKYGGTGGTWGSYDLIINGASADATNPAVISAQSGENFSDAILEMLTAHLGVEKSAEFVNSESFTETRSRVANLICSGAFTKQITWGEALTQLQRSSNIDLFCDRHDRLTVRYATDDDEPVVNLTDLTELYGGSVRQSMAAPAFNRLPYRFSPNYADDTWEEKHWDNLGDQVASGAIMADEPLQLYFVRDPETALLVAERRGDFVDLDAFRFEGTVPLIPTVDKLELAQIVGISHFGGMKAGGYVAEQFKITDLTMDLDNFAYNFKGIRRRIPTPAVVEGTIHGRTAENARNGPFANLVDGELFAVFKHATLNRMAVQRTTDYGANWTEADADNAPAIAATEIASFDAVAVDGNIHIATQEVTSGRVKHHVFSMGLREWTTVDQVVVSSLSNPSDCGVSIEWRYPDEKIFIMFQGDRVQVSGAWYDRGYYSGLTSGSWDSPVALGVPIAGRSYTIERALSGRNNRMHFFYREGRDQYCVSVSAGGTAATPKGISGGNFTYYYTHRNMGGWAANYDRSKLLVTRRAGLMMGRIEVISEGFPLSEAATSLGAGEFVPFFYSYNSNPAIFVAGGAGSGDTNYLAIADCWGPMVRLMTLDGSYKYETGSELQAGPTDEFGGNNTNGMVGNVFVERGREYLCYLFGQHLPERWTSRWLRIDRLPYTG